MYVSAVGWGCCGVGLRVPGSCLVRRTKISENTQTIVIKIRLQISDNTTDFRTVSDFKVMS